MKKIKIGFLPLYIKLYDDTGADRDMNDFVLEAAIVGRSSWRDVVQASNQEAMNELVAREALSSFKSRVYQRESKS